MYSRNRGIAAAALLTTVLAGLAGCGKATEERTAASATAGPGAGTPASHAADAPASEQPPQDQAPTSKPGTKPGSKPQAPQDPVDGAPPDEDSVSLPLKSKVVGVKSTSGRFQIQYRPVGSVNAARKRYRAALAEEGWQVSPQDDVATKGTWTVVIDTQGANLLVEFLLPSGAGVVPLPQGLKLHDVWSARPSLMLLYPIKGTGEAELTAYKAQLQRAGWKLGAQDDEVATRGKAKVTLGTTKGIEGTSLTVDIFLP